MKMLKPKSWIYFVFWYWLFAAVIFFIDLKYMDADWAGLPGFIVSLPLSVLVVTIGFIVEPIAGRYGYEMHVTGYHFEYGFIVCALLNALILYPPYLLWNHRRHQIPFEPPPPPDISFRPLSKK